MHTADIAHQDIKPSNILKFNNGDSKISDLGRVIDNLGMSPFNKYYFAGDQTYAPLEVKYRLPFSDFYDYKLIDINGVGSLIYQTLTGVSLTTALVNETSLIVPNIMRFDYHDALPFHCTAFFTLMYRIQQECEQKFDVEVATQIVSIISEMCHPDMSKRGSPKRVSKNQRVQFRRYSSKLNTLVRLLTIKGYK